MKKLLSLVLVFVMAMGLSGCTGKCNQNSQIADLYSQMDILMTEHEGLENTANLQQQQITVLENELETLEGIRVYFNDLTIDYDKGHIDETFYDLLDELIELDATVDELEADSETMLNNFNFAIAIVTNRVSFEDGYMYTVAIGDDSGDVYSNHLFSINDEVLIAEGLENELYLINLD